MAGFKGTYPHILEPKNRLSLPAKMRAHFSPDDKNTVVLTRGFEPCIYIYPASEWQKLEDKMRGMSVMDAEIRKFIRMILGYAQDYELDKQGRLVIPQPLLQYAGIDKEVLIIGMLNWIELWNPETYKAAHKDFDMEKTAERMMIF